MRLKTIAFFLCYLEKNFNETLNNDNFITPLLLNPEFIVYYREFKVFKKLQKLHKDLSSWIKASNIDDTKITFNKRNHSALEWTKKIRKYEQRLNGKKDATFTPLIYENFYPVSQAGQFISSFSEIIDCCKFLQFSQKVQFLNDIVSPIQIFIVLSSGKFPKNFQEGITDVVAFLQKHGCDHTKWSQSELQKVVWLCMDIYHEINKLTQKQYLNTDETIQKEIARRTKISVRKISKNSERREKLNKIMREIKKSSYATQREACETYFYNNITVLKNELGITSWRTLANHWNNIDPNKARKHNNPVQKIQPLSISLCKNILDGQ